jgi:hypothetical protein
MMWRPLMQWLHSTLRIRGSFVLINMVTAVCNGKEKGRIKVIMMISNSLEKMMRPSDSVGVWMTGSSAGRVSGGSTSSHTTLTCSWCVRLAVRLLMPLREDSLVVVGGAKSTGACDAWLIESVLKPSSSPYTSQLQLHQPLKQLVDIVYEVEVVKRRYEVVMLEQTTELLVHICCKAIVVAVVVIVIANKKSAV